MEEKSKKIISIWTLVGIILLSYGFIIFCTGIYYFFNPQTITTLAEINPNLWWGGIMLVSAVLFIIAGIFANREKI